MTFTFSAARSSRGHLAHAVRSNKAADIARGATPVAACRGSHLDVILSDTFETKNADHEGFKTCSKCARQIEDYREVKSMLDAAGVVVMDLIDSVSSTRRGA